VSGLQQLWHQLGREFNTVWDSIQVWLVSIFDPQAGWEPKAIFGGCLVLVVFWISRRGTKS
jgi:hypothetical protein